MNFIPMYFYLLSSLQLFNNTAIANQKGVYVITGRSASADETKFFDFPNDSIFVNKNLAIEKVAGIETFDFYGEHHTFYNYTYFLIDFKKGLQKEIGKDLENKTKNMEWKDLKSKTMGINFFHELLNDEPYTLEDFMYEGKKVKKLSFVSKKDNAKWEILLEENSNNNEEPVLYNGIEKKFNGRVVQARADYPNNVGSYISKVKFIPLKDHQVLRKLDKCLLE